MRRRADRAALPTGDSLAKQFVNERRLSLPRARSRIHNGQSVTSHARQTDPFDSLSVSLTRDEFCSLTELKGDGRIPTATDERERAGIERASGVRGERRPNGATPARAPFGRIREIDRSRGLRWEEGEGEGDGRAGGRDNNAKYGRREE